MVSAWRIASGAERLPEESIQEDQARSKILHGAGRVSARLRSVATCTANHRSSTKEEAPAHCCAPRARSARQIQD